MARHRLRQREHVGPLQTRQLDLVDPWFALELGQELGERRMRGDVRRAVCPDDERVQLRGDEQVPDQQQRRLVGPLQVIEHQHERLLERGGAEQPSDRSEHQVPVLGTRLLDGGHLAADAELGDEARELVPELRPVVGQQPLRREPHVVGQCFDERLVGDPELDIATAAQHGRAAGVRVAGDLRSEPRLADPRLAGDQNGSLLAAVDARERLLAGSHLGEPIDHRDIAQPRGDLRRQRDADPDRRRWWRRPGDGVETLARERVHRPGPGDAAELVGPALDKQALRIGELVADGARHEHLARAGEIGHARGDVDRKPSEPRAEQLALAGVDAGPELDPEPGRRDAQLLGRGDRLRGAVELDQEAVAAVLDHASASGADLALDDRLVLGEELAPAHVADPRQVLGRANHVCDHQRALSASFRHSRPGAHRGWKLTQALPPRLRVRERGDDPLSGSWDRRAEPGDSERAQGQQSHRRGRRDREPLAHWGHRVDFTEAIAGAQRPYDITVAGQFRVTAADHVEGPDLLALADELGSRRHLNLEHPARERPRLERPQVAEHVHWVAIHIQSLAGCSAGHLEPQGTPHEPPAARHFSHHGHRPLRDPSRAGSDAGERPLGSPDARKLRGGQDGRRRAV